MGWWPCYKHSKDHCAQEVTVKLNYISPVPTRTKSSCSDLSCSSNCYILTIQEMDMFSSSFIVHPFDQTEHFTNWVVILEQMHITQVNPFSLIKDTWPSDSRALVGSLLTTKLGCLDERTQEHVPKKEKKKQKKQRLCLWSIHSFKVYLYGLLCHLSMVFTQAAGIAHLQASSPVPGVVPSLREGNLSFCRWSLHPATLFPHPHRPSSPPISSLLVF